MVFEGAAFFLFLSRAIDSHRQYQFYSSLKALNNQLLFTIFDFTLSGSIFFGKMRLIPRIGQMNLRDKGRGKFKSPTKNEFVGLLIYILTFSSIRLA